MMKQNFVKLYIVQQISGDNKILHRSKITMFTVLEWFL